MNPSHIKASFEFILSVLLISSVFPLASCEKNENSAQPDSFQLSSPAIGSDSLLPDDFTCDGKSVSPPLIWSNPPSGTNCYALLMQHEASPDDIHWYWILYNIPSYTLSIPENTQNSGIQGTNSVNDRTEYAPPCSQGPGRKYYTITLYALSENILTSADPDSVNRQVLISALRGRIIDSTNLTVWYTRKFD